MTKPDTTTGFPEVPEGYFWEVKFAATDGWLRLHLKKKTFWGFSSSVEWTVVEPPFSPEKFYEEGLFVLRTWEAEKKRQAMEEYGSRFIGKYPPKNLKDAPTYE